MNRTGRINALCWVAAFAASLSACATGPRIPVCTGVAEQPTFVSDPSIQPPDAELSADQQQRYAARTDELHAKAIYHDIVLHPRQTLAGSVPDRPDTRALDVAAPIFLVGIEKPRRNAPAHVNQRCEGRDFNVAPLDTSIRDSICKVMIQGRPMLLTHVVAIDGVRGGRYGDARFLYNAYDEPIAPRSRNTKGDETLYENGLRALGTLATELDDALRSGRITDIVVLSTGWNTPQRETLYNTMDWMASIQHARAPTDAKPFRPLYITVSWQSSWEWKLWKLTHASVVTKGNDADELGLTWVNRLVQDAVIPVAARHQTPVTLVGHSYGTRVVGTALYLSDIIRRPRPASYPPIAFAGLQAAFPINRYGEQKGKEPWFANRDPHAMVLLSSSANDTATSSLPIGVLVGGGHSPERVLNDRDGNLKVFGCEVLEADAEGRITEPSRLTLGGPHLVKSDAFINCEMPGTGGGAHSDVFDRGAGAFIVSAMDARAAAIESEQAPRACTTSGFR
ncbi:hypothetical protein [Dokdonella sp.]|uniref:hypothetical protein n=1 Tax=Dokdonella sp. TaxID=2291710 RepID=UPI0037830854